MGFLNLLEQMGAETTPNMQPKSDDAKMRHRILPDIPLSASESRIRQDL